jgi:predicted nucleotidyltransferase
MLPRAQPFAAALIEATREVYGERLVSLAVFGSYARATATPASDIDVLVVATDLPDSRRRRVDQFAAVEDRTETARRAIWDTLTEETPVLSPIVKTPGEVAAGSPLFLDMTDWCELLVDEDAFLWRYLDDLRSRLAATGARRRQAKGGYYWEYKPDSKPLEVIEL